jgi:hypothetical protein
MIPGAADKSEGYTRGTWCSTGSMLLSDQLASCGLAQLAGCAR